jgi:RNA polymerase sigma-70 factor (ECF subfamily)
MQAHLKLENIVEGCLNANKESQNSFYRYFYTFCFSACMSYCQTSDDVREVVNDGFLKIFKNLQSFNARYDNFERSLKGWVKKIMINTAIDHYQKCRKNYFLNNVHKDVFELSSSEETGMDKFYYKDILKLVQRLSPSYRVVFNLYAIEGFKHEEIAKELNISVGTSKSNLARARMHIQKMIQYQ